MATLQKNVDDYLIERLQKIIAAIKQKNVITHSDQVKFNDIVNELDELVERM